MAMTAPAPATVYVETYGCQMNVSDSELMLGKLGELGYVAVDSPEGADVISSTHAPSASMPNSASLAGSVNSSDT
jgi:hypothetical protein